MGYPIRWKEAFTIPAKLPLGTQVLEQLTHVGVMGRRNEPFQLRGQKSIANEMQDVLRSGGRRGDADIAAAAGGRWFGIESGFKQKGSAGGPLDVLFHRVPTLAAFRHTVGQNVSGQGEG
ncbi:MAG: hypothetical protein VXX70_06390 [Bacteroidota bacterium]|nr:hypothetical protein [Bacteroidota bacterium]